MEVQVCTPLCNPSARASGDGVDNWVRDKPGPGLYLRHQRCGECKVNRALLQGDIIIIQQVSIHLPMANIYESIQAQSRDGSVPSNYWIIKEVYVLYFRTCRWCIFVSIKHTLQCYSVQMDSIPQSSCKISFSSLVPRSDGLHQIRNLAGSDSDLSPLLGGRGPATTPEADAAHSGEAEEDTGHW